MRFYKVDLVVNVQFISRIEIHELTCISVSMRLRSSTSTSIAYWAIEGIGHFYHSRFAGNLFLQLLTLLSQAISQNNFWVLNKICGGPENWV